MTLSLRAFSLGLCLLAGVAPASAEIAPSLRTVPAVEAGQGVTSDARYLYAIDDNEIGKYDRKTGRRVAHWQGDPAEFIHMNSCSMVGREMVCAMSNYPASPMASSVEWFDPVKLVHLRSHSFGPGRGSLTWITWHDGSWWACFANYDERGRDPERDHRATTLVRFDAQFVEQGAWLFPDYVLGRFGHFSASGGKWGRDGRLYVTGHNLPELYALELPQAGARLRYLSTYRLPTGGQAFDWDAVQPDHAWTIDRATKAMVESAPLADGPIPAAP